MNVVTVAFYCSRSVVVLATACHPPNDINGKRTAALGAIESDEPSLATVVADQMNVSLINNTESGVIFLLVENTILQNTKARTFMIGLIPNWAQMWCCYALLCCYVLLCSQMWAVLIAVMFPVHLDVKRKYP